MDPSASLSNLRDIAVPEPPPLWPPAPGIWVLLAVALCALAAVVILWMRARERNAYRRAGLALLEQAATTRDVNVILKRVALAVFPRSEVAPLYGDDWAGFLNASCSRSRFADLGAAEDGTEVSRELLNLARTWVRHHRAPSAMER